MLNDRSSLLTLLATRRSGKPREMVAPGPSPEELARILEIAARAPDHGKLFPWRLVVVPDEKRAALAELLQRALAIEDPEFLPAKREAASEFAHQGPRLVVLVSAPIAGHKIPLWEQQLSAGAVAMNLLTATTALGFVGSWITGWAAYSEIVRAAFCAPGERIVGFFFSARRVARSKSDHGPRWSGSQASGAARPDRDLASLRAVLYYNSMTLRSLPEKPVYVRLREVIADAILAGRFSDGDPLPSVRAFAAEEGANPLTVAKAYQGFQDEGLVLVKRGVGMFVAPGARARLRESERATFITNEWPVIAARMKRLGILPTDLVEGV